MHIAYILGAYPQPSETFIQREIEGMRSRRHQLDIFSIFPPETGPIEGITYGWTTGWQKLQLQLRRAATISELARAWRKEFKTRGINVIMAHFGSLPSTVALEAAEDLPYVLSLHARDIYVEAEFLKDKIDHAAAAVTCTRANVDYLRKQFPWANERIQLLYHGLPASWLSAEIPDRTRDGGPLRLLAVGRLVPKKGFDTLLHACAELRKREVNFLLRIIGDGPQQGALEGLQHKLRLDDVVRFTGWSSQGEVRKAYAWADLFCCPSVQAPDGDRDGLPNVVVEAMSTGLPAIGTILSGIPEAVVNETTGLLTLPGDAIAFADAVVRCQDEPFRAQLATAAAAHARATFDGERSLDTLEGLLKMAVEVPREPSPLA